VASWKGELEVAALRVDRFPTLLPEVLQQLRDLRFAGGLLVDPRTGDSLDTLRDTTGTHPAPGTTYSGWYHTVADVGDEHAEDDPVWRQWDLTVDADDREHTAFHVVDAPGSDDVARLTVDIPNPMRPSAARLEVGLDTLDVDIHATWGQPDAAEITLGIVHLKFRAGIVAHFEARDGTHVLHVEAALHGRGWRRPVFAIGMIALRRPIVRVFERELERVPEAIADLAAQLDAHPDDHDLALVLVDEWLDHVRG
jgi:hypothetical protein